MAYTLIMVIDNTGFITLAWNNKHTNKETFGTHRKRSIINPIFVINVQNEFYVKQELYKLGLVEWMQDFIMQYKVNYEYVFYDLVGLNTAVIYVIINTMKQC